MSDKVFLFFTTLTNRKVSLYIVVSSFQSSNMNQSRLIAVCTIISALTAFEIQAETDFQCPESPNCVSSLATGEHYIEPFQVRDTDPEHIKAALINILKSQDRMEVTGTEANVITAVATSKWFRFKDDITLRINQDGTIDVKSASRTGYSDFGVNRERVAALRSSLEALQTSQP
ncbi:DUF1499 domain-containing protein [Endozoicomonadaceae bacterium StTr2]